MLPFHQPVAVGFAKPIGQPRNGGADQSAELVRLTSGLVPAPSIAVERAEKLLDEGRRDDLMEEVVAVTESLSGCDIIVVDGLVPAPDRVWSARLDTAMATAFDADVLLVADGSGDSPGFADPGDHRAAAVALAAAPYRIGERLRVAGCVVNRVSDTSRERVTSIAAASQRHGIALAGAVPLRPELSWPRVADVIRELGARTLRAGADTRRVTDVLVCAQAVPGLLPQPRDGGLLLVPGDRHDVVMTACLAALGGVRLAGLLRTAGIEPAPKVLRLTTAVATTGMPILVVEEHTYTAAVRLHDMDPELSIDDADRAGAVARTVADALDPTWLVDGWVGRVGHTGPAWQDQRRIGGWETATRGLAERAAPARRDRILMIDPDRWLSDPEPRRPARILRGADRVVTCRLPQRRMASCVGGPGRCRPWSGRGSVGHRHRRGAS